MKEKSKRLRRPKLVSRLHQLLLTLVSKRRTEVRVAAYSMVVGVGLGLAAMYVFPQQYLLCMLAALALVVCIEYCCDYQECRELWKRKDS